MASWPHTSPRSRRRLLAWGAACALALQGWPAGALDPGRAIAHYVHQEWHAAGGLPQETVEALAQGADGYLWIGTQDGLARYDGARFTVFTPRNTPGLASRHIQSLVAGRDGEIWIGTARGLHRYRQGTITPFGSPEGLGGTVVRRLVRSRSGAILAGTTSGLFAVEGDREVAFQLDGAGKLEVLALAEGPAGEIVVSSPRGVFRAEGHRLVPHPVPPVTGVWRSLHFARDGALWIAGKEGLWRWQGGAFARAEFPVEARGLIVSGVYQDRDDLVWAATNKGLGRIRPGAFPAVEGLLPDVRLGVSWAEDHEGGLWIGTWGNGLHRLRAGRATVLGKAEGLAGDYALGMLETRDGAVWLGTEGGLTRLAGGAARTWREADGLLGPTIRALHEEADGTLWIGTNAGLCRLERDRPRCGLGHLRRPNVFAIEGDGRGGLWVATFGGVDHLPDARAAEPTSEPVAGVVPGITWLLHRARDGSLWVAGEAPGLVRMGGGTVRSYLPPEVPLDSVISVHEEEDGTLWFGTAGSGLVRHRAGRFDVVGARHGLPDDVIFAIVPDAEGGWWLSSNHGVFRVARDALEAAADGAPGVLAVDTVGLADGLRSAECNGTLDGSGLRTRDGRLWFPTTSGVAVIDPKGAVTRPALPAVVEELLADRKPVALAGAVVLPPGRGELEFRFAAVSFVARESARLRYRLEGFDEEWREALGERTARYTNLAPGRYTFRVASVAPGAPGQVVSHEASLPVALQPAWHELGWVRALGALLALSLLPAVGVVRMLQLRARQRALQRAVDEALGQVQVLHGLLPVCAWCKRVRADQGYWQQIETYVSQRSRATFTHAMCPSCAERLEAEDARRDAEEA